jgi:MtN3 and saliva related transmembrane protein
VLRYASKGSEHVDSALAGGGLPLSRKREVTIIISTRRVLLLFLGTIVLSGCEGLLVTDTQSLLAPTFTRSEILGLIAGFGTTFAALPDLISMVRRRSSAGMNPKMAAIMGAFQILWIWYGLLIGSRPVVLWNLIAVVTNSFVVGAYRHYARRERERSATTAG